jgi:hypothetical protein
MYKGKERCAGCGKSGIELPRVEKDKLCHNCREIYNKGVAERNEEETEYTQVFQHFHAFYNKDLGSLAIDVLQALNNSKAKSKKTEPAGFKYNYGSNGIRVNIPSKTFELLKDFFVKAEEVFSKHREEVEKLPKIIEEKVREEKNRIYNEGIEAGRDLLNQLNRGELTIEDFNKTVIKY